ncbi:MULTISPECIES: DUF2771 family protein [Prescottella]|jgi:hypothetical protein|uniref:DUF2771 domain-containing protein n=3 Tax=Rhodococcus hoagii TaxID=43767 RepID=E9T0H2_RHOHA|nr:DUF2771 family protein [Prescottella equi]MBU4617558.1 DUF2771 family protein [Rhodococcus sp. GG48]MCD7053153.1 DUF2771 domain-containing protein [Rhodococcus sp. BH2-1]EGD23841.1 hypothetical protein HMPREF0724_12049 [Prescottella equi ATCC 33707]ERN47261.1 hypothetical protein H849_05230 [Prescottella equi NBRC 101255 = C 7]MBM4468025.1 DUF2771 family protein [Prescottella equi]
MDLMMQDRTKKILALIAAVVIVAAAGLAGVVAYLVGQSEEKLPTITAYSKQETATVVPGFCDPSLQCEGLEIVELHVPEGYPLQLSLPKEIADSDWRLNVQIGNPKTGEIYEGYRDYKPGDAWAVTVPGAPGEQLISAIIQLPAQGGLAPVWALQTMPLPGGGVVAPAS